MEEEEPKASWVIQTIQKKTLMKSQFVMKIGKLIKFQIKLKNTIIRNFIYWTHFNKLANIQLSALLITQLPKNNHQLVFLLFYKLKKIYDVAISPIVVGPDSVKILRLPHYSLDCVLICNVHHIKKGCLDNSNPIIKYLHFLG